MVLSVVHGLCASKSRVSDGVLNTDCVPPMKSEIQ